MEYSEKIRTIISSISKSPDLGDRAYADGWVSNGKVDREKFERVLVKSPKLIDGLKRQAERFGQDFKNITVLFSGGIDSESMLLGFLVASVKVKVVFFDFIYKGENNHIDYLHATEFCKKHKVPLTIIPFEITDEIIDQYKNDKWYEKRYLFHGLGSPVQNIAFYEYLGKSPLETVVVGLPGFATFSFYRKEQTCSLTFPENTERFPRCYKFFSFYPDFLKTVYQYHKEHLLLQMYPSIKNFKAHMLSEAGLFPRPKSNSIDFMTNQFDRVSPHNRTVTLKNKWRLLKLFTDCIEYTLQLKERLAMKTVTVYEFQSTVDFSQKIYKAMPSSYQDSTQNQS